MAAVALFLVPQIGVRVLRPNPGPRPSVVFVMLDTLRLDYNQAGAKQALGRGPDLPESPTPRLDGLATDGIRFTQAIANASWTKPSVASMITGLVPSRHRAVGRPGRGYYPNLEPEHRTIAEAFLSAGYDTAGNLDHIPTLRRATDLPKAISRIRTATCRPSVSSNSRRSGSAIMETGRSSSTCTSTTRTIPSNRPRVTRVCTTRPRARPKLTGPIEAGFRKYQIKYLDEDWQHLRMSYAEEIRYLDEQVGVFVESILSEHDDLLVVIVSDHGEEFYEHGDIGHGHSLNDELLRVPLQISWSAELARFPTMTVDAQVGLADLTPTLLEYCRIPWPLAAATLDGASILKWLEGNAPTERSVCSETDADGSPRSGYLGPLRSHREPSKKLIQTLRHSERPETPVLYWYFDLAADPGETRNLFHERPGRALELRDELAASPCMTPKGRGTASRPDRPEPPEPGRDRSAQGARLPSTPDDPNAIVDLAGRSQGRTRPAGQALAAPESGLRVPMCQFDRFFGRNLQDFGHWKGQACPTIAMSDRIIPVTWA